MSHAKGYEYSRPSSPYERYGRSISRSTSKSRSRSRSHSGDVENPGNNLYVTGLSPQMTKRDLEDHFAREGKVVDVHLVVDPWSRESRGFGFVTMSTVEEANRCIKYLDRSALEGRVITVEKARRRRGRTPTSGRYLGLKTVRVRRRSTSYCPRRTPSYSPRRRRSRTPYSRSRSPRYSSDRSKSRSYSPYYRSHRSYSPPHRSYSRRSYSPYYGRRTHFSRSCSPYSQSPVYRRDRSYSSNNSRDYPYDDHYRRICHRSVSRCRYSRRNHSRSYSPWPRRRSYSPIVSPGKRSRRSYSRSVSPRRRRSYSRSVSPRRRRSGKHSYTSKRGYSRDSRSSVSRSQSVSASSRDVSRSVTPRSASPSS